MGVWLYIIERECERPSWPIRPYPSALPFLPLHQKATLIREAVGVGL